MSLTLVTSVLFLIFVSNENKWKNEDMENKTEVTSVKLVLFKFVMSFETLTKVDRLAEIC